MIQYFLYYLAAISFISAILFVVDKIKATHNKWRISEKTLHVFELLGGVFINLVLMYVIRHKNRKTSYFILTYLILVLWIVVGYFAMKNHWVDL